MDVGGLSCKSCKASGKHFSDDMLRLGDCVGKELAENIARRDGIGFPQSSVVLSLAEPGASLWP